MVAELCKSDDEIDGGLFQVCRDLKTCVLPSNFGKKIFIDSVRACQPGLGDISKPTAPAYFWGVKLMFVGVVSFSLVPLLRFVVLKIFRSFSNPNFGHTDLVM